MQEKEIVGILKDLYKNRNVTNKYFKEETSLKDCSRSRSGLFSYPDHVKKTLVATDDFHNKFKAASIVAGLTPTSSGHGEGSSGFPFNSLSCSATKWIFSEIESEVKQELLTELEGKLIEVAREDETVRSETDRQLREKEEQVRALEERVKATEEQTRTLEKRLEKLVSENENINSLYSAMNKDLQTPNDLGSTFSNKATEDCFLVDKDEHSEDFEFIENNFIQGVF